MSKVEANGNGLRAFETLGQFLEEAGWYPQQVAEVEGSEE